MIKKIFKGIKQVSATQFNEAKELGSLAGYLWFVRTEVLVDGEETNTPENDNYDIYFGSRQYGHFRAGELDAIRAQIESLNGDITAINEALEGLVTAAETAQAAIAKEIEDRKAADEELKSAYEQADADMSARIDVIEGDDAGKSMRTVASEELAKQLIPEGAKEALDTLEEIAAWIQQHPEDAAAMNTAIEKNTSDIATNAEAIAKNTEDIAGLNTKVDEIPVIEELKVNGVSATIEDGVAKVEINGDNIGVGSDVPGYDPTANISTVLKGIIESFAAASDGTIVSVSSGDTAININTENPITPVISLNTETSTEETVTEGHIEIKKGATGIYGVMYYSGDDAE